MPGASCRCGVAEKLPLWRNIRWLQLVYGLVLGIAGYRLWAHYRGSAQLATGALVGAWLLVAISTLVFVIYLQNVYRFGLVPDYSKKCRYCNGPVNRYSEFCEHCGADLIAEDKILPCPKCGVELFEGTKHCPECGTRIARPEKKGKKRAAQPAEGWDEPIDAVTGLPPPRDDERR